MNKGLTVKELAMACMQQIEKGNGDKHVLITSDDEGNEYHTLFYQFDSNIDNIIACKESGLFHDNNDVDEVILLG